MHRQSLENLGKRDSRFTYALVAAGDSDDEAFFDDRDPLGGLAPHRPIEGIEVRKVAMSKIDHLVAEIGLYGPHLLKLDTHGFELPIPSGHQECST